MLLNDSLLWFMRLVMADLKPATITPNERGCESLRGRGVRCVMPLLIIGVLGLESPLQSLWGVSIWKMQPEFLLRLFCGISLQP